MSTKTVSKLAVASVLAFAASASQAAIEDTWVYTLNLQWDTSSVHFRPDAGAVGYPGGTTITDTLLSWGALEGSYKGDNVKLDEDDADYARNRSALEITTSYASGTITTNGGSVAANMFTHYNNPIWSVYPSLELARLTVSVDLGIPGIGSLYPISRSFEVHFKETPNTGLQCGYGLCDDDIFAIISVAPTLDNLTSSFEYNGIEYTFNYFESTDYLKPLSAAACQAAGIAAGIACYGFKTTEGLNTPVQFAFSITAVPEPETYAMLLAGLGMVGVVARRRRHAIRN
ncbi:MAG: THxN family PEP-CTERM protein [Betaproteobacteria bacterium]|nr:THxN family PEP-CTERM protein [Betaproteobacteria bacterium]